VLGALRSEPENRPKPVPYSAQRVEHVGLPRNWPILIWATVLLVSSWPFTANALLPSFGVDAGWQAALALDAGRLHFGTQVAFTYGPLGFLEVPKMYDPPLAVAGVLYLLAAEWTILAIVLWRLRKVFSWPVAIALTYLVGLATSAFPLNTFAPAVLLIVGVWALQRDPRTSRIVWTALGGLAALMLLVKVSVGISCCTLLLFLLIATGKKMVGPVSWSACGGIATFALGWFSTGNGLSNILPYVHSSIEETSGYAEALSFEAHGRAWDYLLALGTALILLSCVLVYRGSVDRRAQRNLVVIAVLVAVWFEFKEGFIRHDGHDTVFFAAIPVMIIAFVAAGRTRRWIGAGALLTAICLSWWVNGSAPSVLAQPWKGATNLTSELRAVTSGSRQRQLQAVGRKAIDSAYPIPVQIEHAVHDQTLDVEFWDESVVWALGARYDPFPVPQDSSAYTSYLDGLDASFVESSRAPRYILRFYPLTLNGEYRLMYPPETTLAVDCRYRQEYASKYWQLLERGQNRCGTPTVISTVKTGFGKVVTVPRAQPDDFVVMKVSMAMPVWWQAANLLFKAPHVWLNAEERASFRYVTAMSEDPSIVRVPDNLEYSPTFSFSFFPLTEVRFSFAGMSSTDSGVRIVFEQVPFH
jgi:hypothetical protein